MKLPLTVGAYEARSIIASAQRCVNLYPEQNPSDSPFPTTHYCTSGLVTKSTAPTIGWRGAYTATNGKMYAVVGASIYRVMQDFTYVSLGAIALNITPVSMNDNGATLVIVDGTTAGYAIDLNTDALALIVDPAFYGSNRVDVVDGYFVFNRPGTNQWYISLFLSDDFDALDFAGKTGYSDLLVCAVVAKRYVYLLGQQTCEIWYNEGDTDFTFARMPGAFIQHGCAAVSSPAVMDGQVFFLSQDPQGHAIVMRTANFDGLRISTHALENEFQTYSRLDDAQGFTHQEGGHYFYVLTFPTQDKTWCFDMATQQWHERVWIDTDGQFHRHRAGCFTFFNGMPLVGDWENGKLYNLTPEAFDDDGVPQIHIRSFPHVVDDGNRIMYRQFIADMEIGDGIDGTFTDPEVLLRWSDTKGRSWGNPISGGIGATGEYLRCIQFQRLGYARDRVFELSWSAKCKTALNGAFLDVKQANE
jgi:hypothetical protein